MTKSRTLWGAMGWATLSCGGLLGACSDEPKQRATPPVEMGPCVLANADAMRSAGGRCVITQCTRGHDDCNHDATDGCEADLTAEPNCGSCGQVCVGAHATRGACVGNGLCVLECEMAYYDVDAVPGNGCEATDPCASTIAEGQLCRSGGAHCVKGDQCLACADGAQPGLTNFVWTAFDCLTDAPPGCPPFVPGRESCGEEGKVCAYNDERLQCYQVFECIDRQQRPRGCSQPCIGEPMPGEPCTGETPTCSRAGSTPACLVCTSGFWRANCDLAK